MLTRSLGVSAALAMGLFPFHAAQAQLPKSARLFEQYCITCHGNVQSQQAPDVNALRRIAPEAIYDVLTNRSTHAQAMAPGGALQGWQLCDGVVIRLAFAVAQPRQKAQRHNDNADTYSKLCPFLHG